MTSLILCRHAESEDNRERRFGGHGPAPLTERGRAQAQATAVRLQRDGVEVLYSSDLARAEQTAQLIGAQLALSPRLAPALRERSVGIFTGLRFDEARTRYPQDYQVLLRSDPGALPAEGESQEQCRQRATAFLDRVLCEHAGQRVLLVSHHLTLSLLVMHLLGLAQTGAEPRVFLQLHNCALHRFERHAGAAWHVLALNDSAHLSERLQQRTY